MKRYLPHFIALAFFLTLLANKYDAEYGFSELAGFGEDYDRPQIESLQALNIYHKPHSTGYDGQFYAQIALDPSLSDPVLSDAIDHPSYRARRILLPTVAYVLGLGQPAAVLQIHSLLNVACLLICGVLLLRWLPPNSLENFARWFCCVFSMGALESVRYSLADLPALTLALATISLLEKNRGKLAVVANTLAAFSKETSLINAATFLSFQRSSKAPFTRQLVFGCIAGAIAVISLGLWMLYASSVFPITVNSSDNIGLPFGGLYRGLVDSFVQLSADSGEFSRYFFRILAIIGLLFQLAYLALNPIPQNRLWILGILYGVLFLTLGDAVWRGYWAGCRIALPLTFAFNILLSSKNKAIFWLALGLSNITALHAIIRWL